MADTLDEIAYNLLNKIEGGRSHNNTYYSLDQIKYNVENYRALFLRRDLRDSHDIRNFEQKLEKPIFRITQYTTPDVKIKYVLKTEEVIPSLLRTKHQYPLTVHDKGRREFYPVTHSLNQYWQTFNKYSKTMPISYILDGYLYIDGDLVSRVIKQMIEEDIEPDTEAFKFDISALEIYGVFERPTEVMIANGVDPTEVGSQPYPITKDLTQRITEGLINGELQMIMQSPNDTKHNTLPDHQLG